MEAAFWREQLGVLGAALACAQCLSQSNLAALFLLQHRLTRHSATYFVGWVVQDLGIVVTESRNHRIAEVGRDL